MIPFSRGLHISQRGPLSAQIPDFSLDLHQLALDFLTLETKACSLLCQRVHRLPLFFVCCFDLGQAFLGLGQRGKLLLVLLGDGFQAGLSRL